MKDIGKILKYARENKKYTQNYLSYPKQIRIGNVKLFVYLYIDYKRSYSCNKT